MNYKVDCPVITSDHQDGEPILRLSFRKTDLDTALCETAAYYHHHAGQVRPNAMDDPRIATEQIIRMFTDADASVFQPAGFALLLVLDQHLAWLGEAPFRYRFGYERAQSAQLPRERCIGVGRALVASKFGIDPTKLSEEVERLIETERTRRNPPEMTSVNRISSDIWDDYVEAVYGGRPYRLWKQGGGRAETERVCFGVPNHHKDPHPDTVEASQDCMDCGVSLRSWLAHETDYHGARFETKTEDPHKRVKEIREWWYRHHYPDIHVLAQHMYDDGWLPAGQYEIVLD